jgi:hypothetical protein
MAEKTAIFGRMFLRQRGNTLGRMALLTEFFRFFFIHFNEPGMVFITGHMLGGFLRGVPEKEKKSTADQNKNDIVDDYVFAFLAVSFGIHWVSLVSRPSPAC